jgi:hypothetical protein
MVLYKFRIYKAMSRSRVDKSGKSGDRDQRRDKRYTEGVWIGKSGRVETDYLGGRTRRVNAVLSVYGGWRTA